MIHLNDPRQTLLFDRVEEILHPGVKAKLDADWPGVFRRSILKLMPVESLGEGFSVDFGRPSKEHYSICGLILLKDYFGWSDAETVDKYLYDLKIQYALKIQPDNLKLGLRTLERYLKLFREKELAQKLMADVSAMIVRELNIEVDKQRLDSTHVFSNMADWNRSTLLFRTIKRFLVQEKRHESKLYHELDEGIRRHYDRKGEWIYDAAPETRNVRYGDHVCSNREQLGWDMLRLIERFKTHPKLSNMNTFKDMVRIFNEQCEIDDGKVKIRKHPGGEALVNPSDPDAGIDQKGTGYQAQVSETCNPENPVQIVTAVLPQSASEPDQNAVEPMLELMSEVDAKPCELLADSGYGSDENVTVSKNQGIDLISPSTGKDKEKVGLEECQLDDANRIIRGPRGCKPLSKKYAGGKGRAVFAASTCAGCTLLKRCSASKQGQNYVIAYDARSLRLRTRRLHEQTDEFKKKYRKRSGIESLFGRLKQNTRLRRLRVRGKKAVFNTIYAIMTGHNIMQLAKYCTITDRKTRNTGILSGNSIINVLIQTMHFVLDMKFIPENPLQRFFRAA
jgi:hypothetical protein